MYSDGRKIEKKMASLVSLSRRPVIITLFLTVILSYTEGVYRPFHCLRTNTECYGTGSRCKLDGNCECSSNPSARQGYDCGLIQAEIRSSGCAGRACQNGGICYTDAANSVDKCYCPAAYYGERCELRRVQMRCNSASMFITVNPNVDPTLGFVGLIYALPRRDCKFTKVAASGEGYELQLPLGNGPCASARKQTTNSDGATAYTYDIVTRFQNGISTYLDESHVITCTVNANGTVSAFSGTGYEEIDPQSHSGVNANRGYQPVGLLIKHRASQSVVSRPVRVGEELFLEFELPETDILYADYRVDSCTGQAIDPNNNETITQELPLISGNCIDSGGASVIDGQFTKTDRITRLDIRAFKFFDTSIVHFICSLTLCPVNTTTPCEPVNCTATSGSGRRKRQTTTVFVKSDVIGQTLQVYDIYAQPDTECPQTDYVCDMMYFYLVLAVLAFFAILSFLCAIYLCFKMARRKRRYDTIVIRKRTLPDGNVVRSIEEVHPGDRSSSSDRGPIINSVS